MHHLKVIFRLFFRGPLKRKVSCEKSQCLGRCLAFPYTYYSWVLWFVCTPGPDLKTALYLTPLVHKTACSQAKLELPSGSLCHEGFPFINAFQTPSKNLSLRQNITPRTYTRDLWEWQQQRVVAHFLGLTELSCTFMGGAGLRQAVEVLLSTTSQSSVKNWVLRVVMTPQLESGLSSQASVYLILFRLQDRALCSVKHKHTQKGEWCHPGASVLALHPENKTPGSGLWTTLLSPSTAHSLVAQTKPQITVGTHQKRWDFPSP